MVSLYYRHYLTEIKKAMKKLNSLLIIILAAVLVTGCSKIRFPGVYRIDIPQGNFVTEDMIKQLKPGMSPEQVTFIMGEPILIDPFTENTWYYPMIYKPGRGETTEQRIVVYFEDGRFSHYEGKVVSDLGSRVASEQDKELNRRVIEQEQQKGPSATEGAGAPSTMPAR